MRVAIAKTDVKLTHQRLHALINLIYSPLLHKKHAKLKRKWTDFVGRSVVQDILLKVNLFNLFTSHIMHFWVWNESIGAIKIVDKQCFQGVVQNIFGLFNYHQSARNTFISDYSRCIPQVTIQKFYKHLNIGNSESRLMTKAISYLIVIQVKRLAVWKYFRASFLEPYIKIDKD